MSAHTVITHAQNQETHAFPTGMRARYNGSQSWGPAVVTVVKPWGGRVDPLYVVTVDGMDPKFTYVVAQSELAPVGVPLAKPGDRANGVIMVPSEAALDELRDRKGCNVTALAPLLPIGAERALDRGDLRALSIVFGVATRIRPRW